MDIYIEKVDVSLLKDQRNTLLKTIASIEIPHPRDQELENEEEKKETILHLDGLINLIDHMIDIAIWGKSYNEKDKKTTAKET